MAYKVILYSFSNQGPIKIWIFHVHVIDYKYSIIRYLLILSCLYRRRIYQNTNTDYEVNLKCNMYL